MASGYGYGFNSQASDAELGIGNLDDHFTHPGDTNAPEEFGFDLSIPSDLKEGNENILRLPPTAEAVVYTAEDNAFLDSLGSVKPD